MGNRSSNRTNDWESDEDGESDYEHTYNFHTSVLHKSPADGFESDYDDDDNDPQPAGGRSLRALPSRNTTRETSSAASSASAAVSREGGGDSKQAESTAEKTQNANDVSQKAGRHRQTEDAAQASNCPPPVSGGEVQSGDVSRHPRRAVSNRAVTTHTTNQAVHSTNQVAHSTQQTSQASSLSPGEGRGTSGASGPAPDPGQSVCRQTRSSGQSAPRGDHHDARREGERMEEEEESYETAGEGSGEEAGSEGDSLSTITPPRTRPQSDSEYTVSEETPPNADSEEESEEEEEEEGEEEEEDSDGDEWDRETERGASPACGSPAAGGYQGRASRSKTAACSSFALAAQGSWESAHSRLPRRMEMSAESYRLARKRPPSPKPQRPSKRSRPLFGVSMSPNRTRFGVFDSESESDNATQGRQGRKRRAAPPSPPPRPPPPRAQAESRSMSTRSLRLVARRAASQFVETSRKILQDAKAAARILRESAGKRRSSGLVEGEEEEEDGPSRGKKPSPEKGQRRSSPRVFRAGPSARAATPAHSGEAVSSRGRRGAVKRRGEELPSPRSSSRLRQRADDTSSETDSQTHRPPATAASSREVRKNGGRLRKFTRNSATPSRQARRQSPRLFPCVNSSHSASLPVLPGAAGDSGPPLLSPPGQQLGLNHSCPSALPANPFHNVTLRPAPSKRKWTSSVDSIGPELGAAGDWPSPFSALLRAPEGAGSPQTVTLSAGSVWARVTAHTNHATPPKGDNSQQGSQASAAPGPSGGRMATRTSPEVAAAGYPPNSTPRAPSLSLTGQFAHSGRFAFLLEKVLQVTVVVDSITMATTNGIVVSAGKGLQHSSPAAHTVVQAAGSGLVQACRQFLKRKPQGLQVCEVLDTPAGGRLPPLISHVLHVVVPEGEGGVGVGEGQQRKLLLCTYLNCLKHAAQQLTLSSLALPLFGLETCSTEECVQVFFDSLLVFLAERLPHWPLHAIQLFADSPALGRFIAEVLESRLLALKASSMDAAMAAVFRDYFNVPDFSRRTAVSDVAGASDSLTLPGDRSPYGKPAVKRRRL